MKSFRQQYKIQDVRQPEGGKGILITCLPCSQIEKDVNLHSLYIPEAGRVVRVVEITAQSDLVIFRIRGAGFKHLSAGMTVISHPFLLPEAERIYCLGKNPIPKGIYQWSIAGYKGGEAEILKGAPFIEIQHKSGRRLQALPGYSVQLKRSGAPAVTVQTICTGTRKTGKELDRLLKKNITNPSLLLYAVAGYCPVKMTEAPPPGSSESSGWYHKPNLNLKARLPEDLIRALESPSAAEPQPDRFSPAVESIAVKLKSAGITGIDTREYKDPFIRDALNNLCSTGRALSLTETLYIHTSALDEITSILKGLWQENRRVYIGDVKRALGVTRRYAVPLLEILEQNGTIKRGEEDQIER